MILTWERLACVLLLVFKNYICLYILNIYIFLFLFYTRSIGEVYVDTECYLMLNLYLGVALRINNVKARVATVFLRKISHFLKSTYSKGKFLVFTIRILITMK